MPRQSISFTLPNDEWLKAQVESQEYTSKSDVINDLIRRAREHDSLRSRLIASEQSGLVEQTADEMLAEFKRDAGI
ncbi:MAG: CopG family transcriptional regulator [Pseudomonadota bacterium]